MIQCSYKLFRVFLFLSLLICSYSSVIGQIKMEAPSEETSLLNYGVQYNLHSKWVDSVFNSLTQDERIAQLIMIAAYSDQGQDHIDDITCQILENKIGGLIFFKGSPIRQASETNFYQSISQTPLLIGIDGEWDTWYAIR